MYIYGAFFCLFSVPSSAPVLVSTTNLSSSSIAVVWQRPLEANGEITEYTVNLSGPGGSNSSQTSSNSVIFTNLLPYTPYNLTITAATRKGSGHQGLLLQLHTDEDGDFIYLLLFFYFFYLCLRVAYVFVKNLTSVH